MTIELDFGALQHVDRDAAFPAEAVLDVLHKATAVPACSSPHLGRHDGATSPRIDGLRDVCYMFGVPGGLKVVPGGRRGRGMTEHLAPPGEGSMGIEDVLAE